MTQELVDMNADDLPDWAADFLDRALGKEVRVVNAKAVSRGIAGDLVLVNTTEGSALVSRWRFGTPSLVRLPLPGRRFTFTCVDCSEQIELHDAEVPRRFHCTRCARRYVLSQDRDTYVLFTGIDGAPEGEPGGPGWTRLALGDAPPTKTARPRVRRKTARKAKPTSKVKTTPTAKPRRKPAAPYRHAGYTLHTRLTRLKNGREQRIYFFAKRTQKNARPTRKPTGYEAIVTRTGLPVLRRKGARTKRTKKPRRTLAPRPGTNSAKNGGTTKEKRYQPQCRALNADGVQCHNSARHASKYCGAHFGYRPPRAKVARRRGTDTKPRVKRALDTRPSYRHEVAVVQ